jgi:hypothetical protein
MLPFLEIPISNFPSFEIWLVNSPVLQKLQQADMEEKRQVPWEKAESFEQQEGLPLGTKKWWMAEKRARKMEICHHHFRVLPA